MQCFAYRARCGTVEAYPLGVRLWCVIGNNRIGLYPRIKQAGVLRGSCRFTGVAAFLLVLLT